MMGNAELTVLVTVRGEYNTLAEKWVGLTTGTVQELRTALRPDWLSSIVGNVVMAAIEAQAAAAPTSEDPTN